MLVVLHTKSTSSPTQRIHLRTHQVAQFGRSNWADYSFLDPSMAEVHFEIRCTPEGCRIRNLSTEGATLVNGQAVETADVYHGDEVVAGATRFTVTIEGESAPPPAEAPAGPDSEAGALAAAAVTGTLLATCVYLDFSKEIQELSDTTPSADDLIAALVEQKQFMDALRLRAYLLPKRDAVWWACFCVRELNEPLPMEQAEALEASLAWVSDPSEEHRRDCEEKANAADSGGPGGMLALSAFWSDGSITPPDAPHVSADNRLTCQGVAAGLMMAAYLGDPGQANDRLQTFLANGADVAAGKRPYPTES